MSTSSLESNIRSAVGKGLTAVGKLSAALKPVPDYDVLRLEDDGGFRDGRVTSCEVTGSSGNSALDQAACRNLQRRGRFEPALDRDGNPVASTYTKRVTWRLPQD